MPEKRCGDSFLAALHAGEASSIPMIVIGGGTNLIVSDRGYRGLVLRYRNDALSADGNRVTAGAGAELQRLVDFTIGRGLKSPETLAGIPGWTGAPAAAPPQAQIHPGAIGAAVPHRAPIACRKRQLSSQPQPRLNADGSPPSIPLGPQKGWGIGMLTCPT